MITLTLLHPSKSNPLRCWTFRDQDVIRIGRSTDNDLVLYSAVVSRHHMEIRKTGDDIWELENLGANGTYLDGKPIKKTVVTDGIVLSVAGSGPKIQIYLREYHIPDIIPLDTAVLPEDGEQDLKSTAF